MANIKISELNELYEAQKDYNDYVPVVDTSADETKKISVKNLIRSNVQLIAVTDTEPAEYETGDKYYNTTDNRIYTATSSGWANAETPIRNIFYVVISDKTTYTYDDDNETLISVGGGAGGGGETLPIGTVLEFPTTDSTKVPDGWLFCDGSAVSRTTYADLFAIIGTSFGAGDGSTTFNLPTKEGLVSVGIKSSDTDFDTIGETGGSKYLQEHTHRTAANLNHNSVGLSGSQVTGAVDYGAGTQLYTEGVYNLTTGNSGNLQPYTVTNYIIKATQTTPVQAEVVNDYSTSQENAYSCDYINDSNSYSTSEVKTNKRWVDNKPIYRKTYLLSNVTSALSNIDVTSLNIDKIINLYGMSYNNSLQIPVNFYNTGNFNQCYYSSYIKAIQYQFNFGSDAYITIEYTKTTD